MKRTALRSLIGGPFCCPMISRAHHLAMKGSPMNEYIEKTPPMKFPPIRMVPPISSPMDTEKTSPMNIAERPSDECREDPSDEKSPPMNIGERPSDELVEDPSDEDVRAALGDLVRLTQCWCASEFYEGAHAPTCEAPWRPDVTLVARVLGYVVLAGEGGGDVVHPSPVTAAASTVAVTTDAPTATVSGTVTGGAGHAVPWWGVRGPTWP